MNCPDFDPLAWILNRNAEFGGIWADPVLWWDQTRASRELALDIHQGQTRTGSELPYAAHLAETAAFCATSALSAPGLIDLRRAVDLGWLHDSVEDQGAPAERLIPVVGAACFGDIEAMSKNPDLPKSEAMADSLFRIRLAGAHAAVGKLSDRASNLLSPAPQSWSADRVIRYRDEGLFILNELGPLAPDESSRALTRVISSYGPSARRSGPV